MNRQPRGTAHSVKRRKDRGAPVLIYETFTGGEPARGFLAKLSSASGRGFGVEMIELKGSQENALAGKEVLAQHLTQGIVHFAFEVANVDATATVLRERAVKFACEPTNLAELGLRYFHIYDCDGNLLEFGQRI